jgi:hypothetical protein
LENRAAAFTGFGKFRGIFSKAWKSSGFALAGAAVNQ